MSRIYVGVCLEGHSGYFKDEDDFKKYLVELFNKKHFRTRARLIDFGDIKLKVNLWK